MNYDEQAGNDLAVLKASDVANACVEFRRKLS
jgi:hypothetical protein